MHFTFWRRNKGKKAPKEKQELKKTTVPAWKNITVENTQHLVLSVSHYRQLLYAKDMQTCINYDYSTLSNSSFLFWWLPMYWKRMVQMIHSSCPSKDFWCPLCVSEYLVEKFDATHLLHTVAKLFRVCFWLVSYISVIVSCERDLAVRHSQHQS